MYSIGQGKLALVIGCAPAILLGSDNRARGSAVGPPKAGSCPDGAVRAVELLRGRWGCLIAEGY